MPAFQKYVRINDSDIALAIRKGVGPMQRLFDPKHDRLPFFWNMMSGGAFFGNRHHPTYSISHVPGRWLNALLSAQDALGVPVEEATVDALRRWTYESVEEKGLGLPCCIDTKTFQKTGQCDLHNLREVMHACYALVKYRSDERALGIAKTVIDSVDRYYDFENARFKKELFLRERGGTLTGFLEPDYTFPMAFGRYIGPLVKLYRAAGLNEALDQALRLKETCFRLVLDEAGGYDAKLFGFHTHSTTAMLSSLAQLGEAVGDMAILERVKAFMENGLRQIATDFGWCLEFYDRDNLGGEANNTADILETCLILGRAGYAGFYERAELILRAHLLPAQLLDAGFVPDRMDPEDETTYRIARDTIGAFGFPCPWGHEYEPGSPISFNWDIVGGAVGGLCEAWRAIAEERGGLLSVNLLFGYEDGRAAVTDPYENGGTLTLTPRKAYPTVRVRLSDTFEEAGIRVEGCDRHCVRDGFLYLWRPAAGETIRVSLPMRDAQREYRFRDHVFRVRFHGQRVTGMSSAGKRLCFFPEID